MFSIPAGLSRAADPNAAYEPARARVVVKFKDDTPDLERLYDATYRSDDQDIEKTIAALPDLLDWGTIVRQYPAHTFGRVFVSLTLDDLQEIRARIDNFSSEHVNPCVYPTLPAFYRFDFRRPRAEIEPELEELAERLRGSAHVELAYVDSEIGPPTRVPGLERFMTYFQGFFDPPAVGGIGIRDAQTAYKGSDGKNTRFVDVEQGWIYHHVDLPTIPMPTPISGVNREWVWSESAGALIHVGLHGLMVLGLVVAKDDLRGVTGIAPRAAPYLASEWTTDSSGGWIVNTANAIAFAARWLSAGDVILIEGQRVYGASKTSLGVRANLPVEANPDIFAAIALARCLGVIVIEPAGNNFPTGFSLNNVTFTTPGIPDLFSSDSGAILVSAGWNREHGTTFSRADTTNYGSRVDCFADGDYIWALDEPEFFEMPPMFYELVTRGGTSSAAAIVAGVALVLQGIVRQNDGLITPGKMRWLLATPGTSPNPTSTGADPQIGVMPNLPAIEAAHGPLSRLHTVPWP